MKQFKTRDSATAFMRKHGVKKEHYNNFITSDVVGGKPVFTVDVDDMEQYLILKKNFGDGLVDGNYDREGENGEITYGTYFDENGNYTHKGKKKEDLEQEDKPDEKIKTVKEKPKQEKAEPPLAGSEIDKRARERLESKKKPTVVQEGTGRKKRGYGRASIADSDAPATTGILTTYPETPTKSIRAFIIYLILEGLDNIQIYGAMKEVFGEDKSKGKSGYPYYYRRQLQESKQLGPDGKPHKH